MLYLLITVLLQNGITDVLFSEHTTRKKCLALREETLKWNNEATTVNAFCVKQVK